MHGVTAIGIDARRRGFGSPQMSQKPRGQRGFWGGYKPLSIVARVSRMKPRATIQKA